MPAIIRNARGEIIQTVGLPAIARPSLSRQFARAIWRWIKAGCPVLTGAKYDARQAICQTCLYWHPDAYLKLGKCSLCGCSGLKLRLATETCQKWAQLNPPKKLRLTSINRPSI